MSVSSLGFETFPRLLPRVASHKGFLRHLSTPCGARRNSFATQISPILSESLTVGIHGPVSKTHLKNHRLSFEKLVSLRDKNGMASKTHAIQVVGEVT